MGSMMRWHEAHVGLARCASRRSRTELVLAPFFTAKIRLHAGGGTGAGVPSRFSSTHLHATRRVRGRGRHRQDAALAEAGRARLSAASGTRRK